jgi:hypothetical protein
METVEDPDERVEQAKASLLARASELGRRLNDARDKLDLRAHITAHPQAAAGIAFALGALLAFRRSRPQPPAAERSVAGAVFAMLGTLTVAIARNVAMRQLSERLKTWWHNEETLRSERENPQFHEPA